ncbi:thioredoxin H-type-like [Prunus avium]|uniref:Thioredoxin H-type-like n=1 Tax=Prunus avium TaxID=42229 RepID=A0A6P5TUZ9_PRUAV|nr:thioredoxin H-type-like [Prunus avium]
MAEENQVIHCNTTEAWEEQLHKGNENKKLLVVDFTAWSYGPCQLIGPILAELAKKNPEITFLKVYVDELKIVSEKWGVDAVPTFLFLKEGKVVDKIVGAKKDELRTKVVKHAAVASPTDDICPTRDTYPTGATATSSESATATCTATATSTATSTDTA